MGHTGRDQLPSTISLAVASLLFLASVLPAPVALAQADLEVIGGGPASASPGATVRYTFRVTNLGPSADPIVTFYVRPEVASDIWDADGLDTLGLVLPGDGTQPDCWDDMFTRPSWAFTTTQGICFISKEYCDPEAGLWPALHVKCEIGAMLANDTATVIVYLPLTMDPPPEADLVFSQPAGMGDWVLRNDDPTKGFNPSSFGASLYFDPEATGNLILAQDNTANPEEGCGVWIGDYTDKIALVKRGSCNFENKVMSAQFAGAVGALIYNKYPFDDPTNGGYVYMAGDTLGPFVNIPNAFIPQEAGTVLLAAMQAGTVTLTMGPQFPLPWYQETLAFVYGNISDFNPDNDSVLDVVEVGGTTISNRLE